MRNLIFVKCDITQTELLFGQSLQSVCGVYVDIPRVILLVTVFFTIQPEVSSIMLKLAGRSLTGTYLYSLCVKPGISTTSASKRLHC